MRLSGHIYSTVSSIKGPLMIIDRVISSRIGEVVSICYPDGRRKDGEVLKIDRDSVLIQVYGDTSGVDVERTSVSFTDSVKKAPLSTDIIGRVFNGACQPIDGLPMFIPEKSVPVVGFPINPSARARPEEFIETGFSVIDGLNTLIKGQKLPIFSSPGLPSKEVASGILKNANIAGRGKKFIAILAAFGLTYHEYSYYLGTLDDMKTDFAAFVNLADDPVMERLLTPRFALTVAEYLAFEKAMDVLVVMADMTNYCDALREVSTARGELPGRRGYPGYMYSDLASLYERAGRIRGDGREISGSVTLLPVVTMPEDDITHPIPDLTGYITEGQIVLSRELHQKGIFPPVDALPSLSRLMQKGIGAESTREDHRKIANLLYKHYARGRDLRRLEAIVGREGMTEADRQMLDFTDLFEREFVHQGNIRRNINETLDAGINLLSRFSRKFL